MNRKAKRAKVVIFSTAQRTTHPRIFHKQARSLSQAAYNVVLFAQGPHDDLKDGVQIRALTQRSSRLRRVLSSLKLIRTILKEKADIHHFHVPELIPVGLLFRLLGKKVIYDAHEDLPKNITSKSYLPPWFRPVLSAVINPLEKWAARRMSAVVAATDSIQRRFPGATVLHNYPILEYIPGSKDTPPPRERFRPFVAYFGTIMGVLGATEMLAAADAVCGRFPIKLKIFGEFENDAIRSQIVNSSRAVDYGGLIPMADVYHSYAGALAGLVLYHPCPNHVEAMPNKIFECMACGVPLIASDFPLWRKIIYDQGCGLVVDPLNVSQIADAIIYLLEHPEEAKKMGQRGRELAERKYNWESEAKKLLFLYERLLSR